MFVGTTNLVIVDIRNCAGIFTRMKFVRIKLVKFIHAIKDIQDIVDILEIIIDVNSILANLSM